MEEFATTLRTCYVCHKTFHTVRKLSQHRIRNVSCKTLAEINEKTKMSKNNPLRDNPLRDNMPAASPPVDSPPVDSPPAAIPPKDNAPVADPSKDNASVADPPKDNAPIPNQPVANQSRTTSPRDNAPVADPVENNVPRVRQSKIPAAPGLPATPDNPQEPGLERIVIDPGAARECLLAPIEIEGYSLNYITLRANFFETLETEKVLPDQRSTAVIKLARTISQEQRSFENTLKRYLALLVVALLDGSYIFFRSFSIASLILAFVYCCMGEYIPQ
ncbi:hypothetical protein INT48_003998 [Thamnidium elegans]|uniref:Uncharacterized protein n=1 Tax=Thamnidium elegans TaxID=101142 RepID=A0A8H7SJB0_9FUNG|nr:hypothetical protein INT48_003998 [Thamnidium elegans]